MNHRIEILMLNFAHYFCKIAIPVLEFIIDVIDFMINIMDKFSKWNR